MDETSNNPGGPPKHYFVDEAGDPAVGIFINSDSICGCGVDGNSRYFDGDDDW